MKSWPAAPSQFCLPLLLLCAAALALPLAAEQAQRAPPAFSSMVGSGPITGWRSAGLPAQEIPATRFELVALEGRHVLRVTADASYGTLVFDSPARRLAVGERLRWSWRLDQGLTRSDLRTRSGDDSPIKVCALFDMPLDAMSFAERSKLRLARALSGQALPSATLCYVWDRTLPVGTAIVNAHSARVRFIVASSGSAQPGQWMVQSHDLGADFMRSFGHEATTLPPLIALLIGADSDNTRERSLAYMGDLTLGP